MKNSLRFFLWLSIIVSCLGVGAKMFDLAVLATAWGASPPESLALMPYGSRYVLDPGDFFIPISILCLVAYLGAYLSGRQTDDKLILLVPVVMIAIMAAITPTVFWPMIRELYGNSIRTIQTSQSDLTSLVRRWFVLDILRTLLIVVSVICHLVVINRRGTRVN